MNMLKWHIKENQRRIENGDEPKDTPRYIIAHKPPFRGEIRANVAAARFKSDTPHGAGKTLARNRRRVLRRLRKAQRMARKAQRGKR